MASPTSLSRTDLVAALPHLRRYARVLTGDAVRADGLVLETLERARGRRHPLPEAPSLRTRLFALMHVLHRAPESPPWDIRAAQSPRPASDSGTASENARTAGDHNAEDLLTRIMRLPLDEREVLLLVAVERLSYGEIATLLDVSISTVMATLSHARESLGYAAPSPARRPSR